MVSHTAYCLQYLQCETQRNIKVAGSLLIYTTEDLVYCVQSLQGGGGIEIGNEIQRTIEESNLWIFAVLKNKARREIIIIYSELG